jgi:hypothetical protein
MDFMKLLESLDDFPYEVVGWIIFYPVTTVRAVLHPIEMLHYSDLELMKSDEQQYSDTFTPPIFLLLTLFLAYLAGKALQPHTVDPLHGFLTNDSNLLLFRGVTFSIFPVLMALDMLRHQGKRIDRAALRPPFYGQCFIAAPFALVASLAGELMLIHRLPYVLFGLALYFIALAWYVAVEIIWFSTTLSISKKRAAWECSSRRRLNQRSGSCGCSWNQLSVESWLVALKMNAIRRW